MKKLRKTQIVGMLIAAVALGIAADLAWTVVRIGLFGAPSATADSRPNILFVTLDTCRADRLSVYGHSRETSPALNRLAKDGFVFTEAFTVATYSAPSHATMFTGLYPLQHGLVDNGLKLSDDVTPLAELLRRLEYQTAAFIGYTVLGTETRLNRGFETFVLDKIDSHKHSRKSMEREVAGFRSAMKWLEAWHRGTHRGAGDEAAADRDPPPPFFLWLHSQQIHQSYDPPAPYDTMFLDVPRNVAVSGFEEFRPRCSNDVRKALRRGLLTPEIKAQVEALYDGEIRLVDDELGRLFDFLRQAGIYQETMIVVTADHGEHLFEETEIDFGWGGFLHGQTYFDSVMRIPLLIKPPASLIPQAGQKTAVTASTIDLFPTIIDLLGLTAPPSLPGRSLVPWMENPRQQDPIDTVYFQESPEETAWTGIRTPDWKFLRKIEDGETSRWLLSLRTDPEERHDHLRENREVAEALEQRIEAWLGAQQAVTPSSLKDMSETMRQALRQAGYLRDEEAND